MTEYERGRLAAIEECARCVEEQEPGTKYQWVKNSLWGNLIKCVAARIRQLANT